MLWIKSRNETGVLSFHLNTISCIPAFAGMTVRDATQRKTMVIPAQVGIQSLLKKSNQLALYN